MNSVSVIIPVYQVEKYLEECLDSVICQTFSDLEIILVDDGSTDDSGTICDRYAEKDSRIRVIHQVHAGLSAARNAGVDIATGKYIQFLDSDDYLEVNAIERLYALAEEKQLEIILFSGDSFLDPGADPKRIKFDKDAYERRLLTDTVLDGETYLRTTLAKESIISVCLCFYQKEYLINGNFSFRVGIIWEDQDYYFYSLLNAKRIMSITESFYHRRYRDNSIMTSRRMMEAFVGVRHFFDRLIESIRTEGIDSPARKQLYEMQATGVFVVIMTICADMNAKEFRTVKKQYAQIVSDYKTHVKINSFSLWTVCHFRIPRFMIKAKMKLAAVKKAITKRTSKG